MVVVLSESEDENKKQKKEPLYSYSIDESESTALESVYDYLFNRLTEVKEAEDP
jgi:hypothetical protein